MNNVVLMGRLTAEPQIHYTQDGKAIANYTLAVQATKDTADFIWCEAWEKNAEFVEKYLHKGTRICIDGRIKTNSFKNKNGDMVYTTKVRVNHHEFADSMSNTASKPAPAQNDNGFMHIPGVDEELPFT